MMQVTKVWWDGEKLMAEPIDPASVYKEDSTCNKTLIAQGKANPRTCKKCGLGPCIADRVQPAQQEPVAKHYVDGGHLVYPTAQRTWVGLTDEERKLVRNSVGYNQFMTVGEYSELVQKATEAKLKEKNQ